LRKFAIVLFGQTEILTVLNIHIIKDLIRQLNVLGLLPIYKMLGLYLTENRNDNFNQNNAYLAYFEGVESKDSTSYGGFIRTLNIFDTPEFVHGIKGIERLWKKLRYILCRLITSPNIYSLG